MDFLSWLDAASPSRRRERRRARASTSYMLAHENEREVRARVEQWIQQYHQKRMRLAPQEQDQFDRQFFGLYQKLVEQQLLWRQLRRVPQQKWHSLQITQCDDIVDKLLAISSAVGDLLRG
jgi:hypothetical protein